MCGCKPQFDAGCAEKKRQWHIRNSGQSVSGNSQSDANAESKWLFGESDCSRGVSNGMNTSQSLLSCEWPFFKVVVFIRFTATGGLFELSDTD